MAQVVVIAATVRGLGMMVELELELEPVLELEPKLKLQLALELKLGLVLGLCWGHSRGLGLECQEVHLQVLPVWLSCREKRSLLLLRFEGTRAVVSRFT